MRRFIGAFAEACHRNGRQGAAIDLAVRQERQRIENEDRGRNHVFGQARGEMRPKDGGKRVLARLLVADGIGDEKPATVGGLLKRDESRRHTWHGEHRAFDLAWLDAEAADLDLRVAPPEKFEAPVRRHPAEVAGEIDAPKAVTRDEGGLGAGLVTEIADGDTRPANGDLAGNARGGRRPEEIEHMDGDIGQGSAEIGRGVGDIGHRIAVAHIGGGGDRGLGRAVGGKEGDFSIAKRRPAPHGARRQRLAAGEEDADGGRHPQAVLGHGVDPAPPQRRRQVEHGEAVAVRQIHEVRGAEPPRLVVEDGGSAGQQRHEELQRRGVEIERRELKETVVRPEAEAPPHAERHIGDAAMGHDDTLGRARRAGGEDHIDWGAGIVSRL